MQLKVILNFEIPPLRRRGATAMSVMGECTRKVLAERAQCKVERCGCGVLHLSVGPFTLRTTPAVLASIGGAIGDAMATLATEPLPGFGFTGAGGAA